MMENETRGVNSTCFLFFHFVLQDDSKKNLEAFLSCSKTDA